MRINELIFEKIHERMEHGSKKYGEEIRLDDSRVFVSEALEEALDMTVYLAASLLRVEKNYSQNLQTKEIERAITTAIKSFTEDNPQINLASPASRKELRVCIVGSLRDKIREKYHGKEEKG